MRFFVKKAWLLAGVAVICATPAMAEEAAGAGAGAGNAGAPGLPEIIVTGSRIAKAGFQAPTPTTVIDSTALAAAPQANIAANLNQLPQLAGSSTPSTSGNGAGGGAQGANFLNLRQLGATRTLVLLDNRRVVAAAVTGSVDLNLLPSTLLKQVDIVTGGASAAWGSDAVAGVVNLVLDKKYTGLKGSVQTGTSTYGDAGQFRAELAGGKAFADGRGHVIASASYAQNKSVDTASSRPWFVGRNLISNPAYVAGNGQPKLIASDGVNAITGTYGGLITAGPLAGTQFLAGGVPAPFDSGTKGTTVTGLGAALGGSTIFAASQLGIGGTSNLLGKDDQLVTSGNQISTFLRSSYDITDHVTVYGEFIYGRSIADSLSVPYLTMSPNGAALTIKRDNAYLPGATATAMDAAKITSFVLNRDNMDLGEAQPHNQRELYRYLVGADVQLGGTWNAKLYYEHGLSKVVTQINNDAIVSNYALAIDAVAGPGGTIVCRSTLTNQTNGCVPFNVFGPQTVTAAQKAYLLGTAYQHISLPEDVAAASVTGDLFRLPAGTVTLATGVEYRHESVSADSDPFSVSNNTNTGLGTGNWWVGNYKPSTGDYTVKEGFGEILVPILKDSPLGRQMDFNGAIRQTNYSTSGSVTTWKAGLVYDIVTGFKLRGVLSRDIRAPNLSEYFLGGTTNSVAVTDRGASVGVLRIQSGNASLKPEVARTFTAGAVFQPRFLPGFNLSVDYFHIKIDNAIATPTPQYIIDHCADGSIPSACNLLIRNASGVLTTVLAQPLNYKAEVMAGADIEASYRFRVKSGSVTLRSLWTYTSKHYLVDNGTVTNLLGEVGQNFGPTKLRALTSVDYDSDSLHLSLRDRFIGQGVIDNTFTSADIADNTVKAVNYIDFSATLKLKSGGRAFELFGAVDNLLNQAPPFAPSLAGNPNTNLGTSSVTYDTIGRYFRAGLRFKM